MSYELDAIAAAVIGGSSLMGGVGRITGTLIGAMILGLIKAVLPLSASMPMCRILLKASLSLRR